MIRRMIFAAGLSGALLITGCATTAHMGGSAGQGQSKISGSGSGQSSSDTKSSVPMPGPTGGGQSKPAQKKPMNAQAAAQHETGEPKDSGGQAVAQPGTGKPEDSDTAHKAPLLRAAIRISDSSDKGGSTAESQSQQKSNTAGKANEITSELQREMRSSGRWKTVEAASARNEDPDLLLSGEVVHNNAQGAAVHIAVTDAAGRSWLDKTYSLPANPGSAASQPRGGQWAQQAVSGQISKDLETMLASRSSDEISAIRRAAAQRRAAAGLIAAEQALTVARGDYRKARKAGGLSSLDDKDYRGFLAQLQGQVEIACLELRRRGFDLTAHAVFCKAAYALPARVQRVAMQAPVQSRSAPVPAGSRSAAAHPKARSGSRKKAPVGAGSGGSLGNRKRSAAPGGRANQSRAGVPADIPDGQDDDVVARQLREAAMTETDPALKQQMWQEYKTYKRGLRRQNKLNKMQFHYARPRR